MINKIVDSKSLYKLMPLTSFNSYNSFFSNESKRSYYNLFFFSVLYIALQTQLSCLIVQRICT